MLLPLSILATTAGATESTELKSGVFSPARLAPDFSARGSDGSELKLSRYRGKVVLLSFGFTSCAEVCPTTLAVLAKARKQLGAAGKDLQIVYVTVDPERDSVERMHKYLATFDPTFIGATGSSEQMAAVRQAYGITATRITSGESYSIAHSSYIYLIDREGRLRALMPFGHSADDFAHDVKILLNK